MKNYKVNAEEGIHLEGIEEAQVKDTVIELDPEAEQTKALIASDSIVELVDHVVTQEDLDANPTLVTEGVQVGETIQLPMSNRDMTEEEKAEIAKQHPDLGAATGPAPAPAPAAATEDASVVAPAPKKLMYMGKQIINLNERLLNDVTYKQVTLEDHTTHDLTEAEYAEKVTEVQ